MSQGLNAMGKDGWELVSVAQDQEQIRLFLKRDLADAKVSVSKPDYHTTTPRTISAAPYPSCVFTFFAQKDHGQDDGDWPRSVYQPARTFATSPSFSARK